MSIQQMLLGASGASGYNIDKSLRFRASASAYLNRTPAGVGNRQIYTLSKWIKRGTLGTNQAIFSATSDGTQNNEFLVYFGANDTLTIQQTVSGSTSGQIACTTNAVFRDPSAWYHFVLAIDTTQATSTNRLLLYVNGVAQTFSSYSVGSSINTWVNNTNAHAIGKRADASLYFDGYLAEVNFVNASQLTPASFGETNALTGVWQPKAYTGAYGTNGFYLDFENTSSVAALGTDFSGNSNTWTVNNVSLTAGVTYDSMTDVPTLTSATAANYAVLNPLVPAFADTSAFSMGSGNLAFQGNNGYAFSTIPLLGNSFYCEFTSSTGGTSIPAAVGIWQLAFNHSLNGFQNTNYRYSGDIGEVRNQAGTTIQTYSTFNSGDVIGVAFNASNGSLFFSKNGTWLGSSNPSTNTNPAVTGLTGSWVFGALSANQPSCWINFGQRPFAYTPPTGFVALNTFNLPTATILKGNTVMDATLYTGNGSTQTITNAAGFQPDLVWAKSRSSASWWHILVDSVRGVGRTLSTNVTNAEIGSGTDCIPALNSNGFNVNVSPNASVNENGTTYVAWQWQAGQGTTSSNTNGSITSTVSVNATAGFSVVTYTGNATAGATVGHGLGVAPAFIIAKARGVASSWSVYHQSLGASQYILLNTTAAAVSSTQEWGGTAPTSSVITIGNASANNNQATTNVLWAFAQVAGYSAFGKYQGNSSADGVFVYTGFRPKLVILRPYDGAADWILEDTSRSPYNAASETLYPNSSGAEASGTNLIDFLSNGFKIRTASGNLNSSANNYLYACFAENPFKNSLAR